MKRALVVGAAIALALALSCRVPDEHFSVGDASRSDARDANGSDANPGPCNLAGPFGSLVAVPGLDSLKSVARFSPDEKTAYFALGSDGTATGTPDTLFVATRTAITASFGARTKLTNVNGSDGESTPTITADGDTIYYVWGELPVHPSGSDRDLYSAARTGSASQFAAGTKLSVNAAGAEDDYPSVAPDGALWFASKRGSDMALSIYRAPPAGNGDFGTVVREDSLNSSSSANVYPVVSPDLLHVYFERDNLVFIASRGSADEDFQTPVTIDELNTGDCMTTVCRPAWMSTDGCRLYLGTGASNAPVTMYVTAKPAR